MPEHDRERPGDPTFGGQRKTSTITREILAGGGSNKQAGTGNNVWMPDDGEVFVDWELCAEDAGKVSASGCSHSRRFLTRT